MVPIDSNRHAWLNIGNDEEVELNVEIWVCFAKTNENFEVQRLKEDSLPAYTSLQPGIDIRGLVRAKLPNFSGSVMVTAKAKTDFVSGIDTLRS